MPSRRSVVGGFFAGALLSPAPALATLLTVGRRPAESFVLANGLQVVVLPSRRAPIVNQLVIYKVGSADEVPGLTGIAHFLEHMMFKGTATVAPTEFSRTVARNGGRDNAFTGYDSTGYHQTIAADRLELIMRLEADRMSNLRIVEKELVPERQVVLEERRQRVDNVPAALLDESVSEQLFGRHKPYGMPTSGYPEDVKKLGVAELTAFYRRYYAPNNAILIIAGDATVAAVQTLAEKYYGPVPSSPIAPRRRPAQGGPDLPQRVVRADVRVAEPRWSRDYLAPSYRIGDSARTPALQVLAYLFGGSETARLSRALVADSKLALSAWASYSPTSLGLATFGLSIHPTRQTTVSQIEAAVAEQMSRLLAGGVTADEVERAQNRLLAAVIYAQDSLSSGPRLYGNMLSIDGTIADIDEWPQRIAAVRPADVVAAAQHVWRESAAVTSLLTPAEGNR